MVEAKLEVIHHFRFFGSENEKAVWVYGSESQRYFSFSRISVFSYAVSDITFAFELHLRGKCYRNWKFESEKKQ